MVLLKGQEELLEFRQRREVIGCENFALNNGEVNLDLIQPSGAHRSVKWNQGRALALRATDGLGAAVRRAIVNDPEDALSRPVGFLAHHLGDQPIKVLPHSRQRQRRVPRAGTSATIYGQRHGGQTITLSLTAFLPAM